MRDLTLKSYVNLINTFKKQYYSFQTMASFVQNPNETVVVLKHDVDSWPVNALKMAKIESEYDIKATYYFRLNWQSFNLNIIRKIVELGHEIGYHYEDLANTNGNYEKAYEDFQKNLSILKNIYPIKTIAMHGRPLSTWNSIDIWKQYNYRELGLICEPFLDIDFNKVLYLTDTGGCWDGNKFSIRDHVQSRFDYNIHSSRDLMDHINSNKLPDHIILNVHPARWNDNILKWLIRQFILTYPKRGIKSIIKKMRLK